MRCRIAVLALLMAGGALAGAAPVERKRPPNVVFILADDWGWGDLWCYGHERLRTPSLDRMAREGILFTRFYVNSPVCSPSRTAFLTGRFPARARMHGHLATPELNRSRAMPEFLDPSLPSVARLLRGTGYATGHFGKWHLGSGPGAPEPDRYGFDEWRVADGRSPDWNLGQPGQRARSTERILDETMRFIEKYRERPFYAQAWLLDTHATLNPTDEQMAPYARLSPAGVPHRSAAQIYYAAATDADRHIGRLLDRLTALGLADNTLVVFSSDNGPEDIQILNASHSGVGSAGPFRGRKRSLYEGGVRVPFIARWPAGMPAGRVDDGSVLSGVDFLPTLAALAGVPLPPGADLDGEDRSPVLRGRPAARTRPLMWEWRFRIAGHVQNRSPMLAIRDGKWKLLMNPDRSRVELYDIPADPGEMANEAARQPAVVKRLAGKLLAWKADLPPGPTDPGAGSNAYPWPGSSR